MNRNKTFISLIITIILAFTANISPITAQAAGEAIILGATIGIVGQEVTISGSGFDPGTPATRSVNIIFGKNPGSTNINYTTGIYSIVQVVPVNADKTFNSTFTVPAMLDGGTSFESVVQGTYYIYLTYHVPPSTNTLQILYITPFNVLGGDISIAPVTGPAGTQVIMSGAGFTPNEELIVMYDNEGLTIIEGDQKANASGGFNNTKIFIPSSIAGNHAVTVIGKNSGHQAGRIFNIEPSLVIRPSPGVPGSSITVGGSGFGAGVNINITFNNNTVFSGITESVGSFVTTFPPNTFAEGSYTVNALDSSGNSDQITYNVYDASITMAQSTGSPGWEVAISGEGFKPQKRITISFEGFGADSNVFTDTDEKGNFNTTFTVPWGTMGKWDIEVTDGSSTKTTEFEVNTSSNIYPITNTSVPGYVGTQIAVAGSQFIAGRTVTITYSGIQVASGTVENDGKFNVTFSAPSSSSGIHIIEASDGTNNIKYGFVMENTPPAKPVVLLPVTGTKAKSETFFDWEDVTDPSGVTYTLQIATDALFSEINMIYEQKGITSSEYTIPNQNRLNAVTEATPYYWRVKAIDKALNESEWTNPLTFFVGFGMSLPQSVIYIIIVGGSIVLAVFTFWLGRKTAFY